MKRILSLLMTTALIITVFAGCKETRPSANSNSSENWVPDAPFVEASESSSSEGTTPEESDGSGGASVISEEQSQPEIPLTQKLVIPEGYTLARIGMTLEDMGIATTEEFITATQTGDFSEFSLIAAQSDNPNRCFNLEGYLYPDTYEIYTNESLDSIIRRILAHTEAKINVDLRNRIADSGYTVDEILTLASIIEKEAFGKEEMPRISSVLHNRIKDNMKLQCDVTIVYVEGAIKPFITGDIDRYNAYYNTYKAEALPAGAICNPSIDAIEAAVTPAETTYLFFLTDKDKNYYYTDDYEEHKENEYKYITSQSSSSSSTD